MSRTEEEKLMNNEEFIELQKRRFMERRERQTIRVYSPEPGPASLMGYFIEYTDTLGGTHEGDGLSMAVGIKGSLIPREETFCIRQDILPVHCSSDRVTILDLCVDTRHESLYDAISLSVSYGIAYMDFKVIRDYGTFKGRVTKLFTMARDLDPNPHLAGPLDPCFRYSDAIAKKVFGRGGALYKEYLGQFPPSFYA